MVTRTKHVPQRTCVACRTASSKREFVRIVRTPEGRVEVDPSGKRAGRGAYICARQDCWTQATKGDRLANALRTTVGQADRDALLMYASEVVSEGDRDATAR